tara:strand:+ start:148675 stop:149583 length:909 start_codon:yes stop_codon:yes gene_type:complete
MTGVCFTNESHLAATHLVGERLFSISVDAANETYTVKHSIESVYEGKPTITDLIDFNGSNLILTSNFDAGSATLYYLENEEIRFFKDLSPSQNLGNCHGARFCGNGTVCLSTNKNYLIFIDTDTERVISTLKMPYHIKDMVIVNERQLVAAFAVRSPSQDKKPTYASGILHIEYDQPRSQYKILDKWFFRPAAFDAICYDSNEKKFYITDQYGDRVVVFKLTEKRIRVLGEITGFRFPHGIDVSENHLAVTNYGDSSIDLMAKETIQVSSISGISQRTRPYTWIEIQKAAASRFRKAFASGI